MNEFKCPFCNKPLQPTHRSENEYWCENYDCTESSWKFGSILLWQELIRTRNALDVAVDALKDIRCVYTGDQTTKPSTMFGRAASALNKIQELDNAETHI